LIDVLRDGWGGWCGLP